MCGIPGGAVPVEASGWWSPCPIHEGGPLSTLDHGNLPLLNLPRLALPPLSLASCLLGYHRTVTAWVLVLT